MRRGRGRLPCCYMRHGTVARYLMLRCSEPCSEVGHAICSVRGRTRCRRINHLPKSTPPSRGCAYHASYVKLLFFLIPKLPGPSPPPLSRPHHSSHHKATSPLLSHRVCTQQPPIYTRNTMASSMCGPSNALSSLHKHTIADRSLQQDRLQSPAPSSQVSYSL